MYETIRIVEKLKPKYVIWENVKNVISKKHKHNFDNYVNRMSELGYKSYYQVLNAKDYGIPQNRERVFTVSIRKDVDDVSFTFPEREPLKLRLKDMLEEQVDEKYYLSDAQIERIKTTTYNAGKTRIQEKDYSDTLCARDWKGPKCVQIGTLDIKGQDCIKRVYSNEGLSPTLTNMQGGNRQPKILIKNATKQGYLEAEEGDGVDISSRMKYHRGTVQKGMCQTIDCQGGNGKGVVGNNLRIRKLTPRECWRLMGFDDEDFRRAEKVNSNTQLYKQARKLNCCKCIRKDT